MATVRGRRGPYKEYLRNPSCPIRRQNIANWWLRGLFEHGAKRYDSDPCSTPQPMEVIKLVPEKSGECTSEELDSEPKESELDRGAAPDRLSSTPDTPLSEALSPALGEATATTHASGSPASTQKLYPGALISESTGALLLHSLSTKHGLTQDALSDILQLCVFTHASRQCTSSLQICVLSIPGYNQVQVVHRLCRDCGDLIGEVPSGSGDESACKFYDLPLDVQIQALFKGNNQQN